MNEKYHSAVNEIIETEGIDAGRVKNLETARIAASGEDTLREYNRVAASPDATDQDKELVYTPEEIRERTENFIKKRIAEKAVEAAVPGLSVTDKNNLIVAARADAGHEGFNNSMNLDPSDEIRAATLTALGSYDKFTRDTKK